MRLSLLSVPRLNQTPRSSRGLQEMARVTALGLAAALAASAMAQPEPKPPIDINAVQPGGAPRPVQPAQPAGEPGTTTAPTTPTPAPTGAAQGPIAEDGDRYQVTRFIVTYQGERTDLPAIEDVLRSTAELGVTPEGYVAPRAGLPTTRVTVGDVADPAGGYFYRSAITAVCASIVETLARQGIAGVFVQLHPEDIDETNGQDLREGRKDLRLVVWTGVVGGIQTIASGDRLEGKIKAGTISRVNPDDPVHNRIRTQSPLDAGSLLHKEELDEFLFRLNRHPGRRVDVAVAPGDKPGEVLVDYLVAESRPWSVYAQISNTGTRATNTWRERFGFVHNQLTNHDDILRVDYITGGFTDAHSLSLNYEFPILSDQVRVRLYGTYSTFEASDVGFNAERFSGTTWAGGAELSTLLFQRRELFIDGLAGIRVSNVQVENTVTNLEGSETFALPYVGLRLDRTTESMGTYGGVTFEYQVPELAGTDEEEISNLGRRDADVEWPMLKWSLEHSFYLEPLLNPSGYAGTSDSGPLTLAHEISASVRGQYAFGQRVIANEEEVAGGFYSVRGYPESAVAGDSAVIGTLEYRFHLPRILPISDAGRWRWWGESPESARATPSWLGENFRMAPQQAFGRPDWDLIFRAFVDGAVVRSSQPRPPGEENDTLLGAGVGIEYQFKRNVSARLDLGVPLDETKDGVTSPGDARLHFSLTLLY
ncbi:MAG TPA: ShlB/FhaC/HecB family hemolysin secretion/activation protein [Phycisphaerales bacterium]|nr:ShlB/FhaC/HecB family hemolysin secretion/activation protein [Phycisphaerales bacterium]